MLKTIERKKERGICVSWALHNKPSSVISANKEAFSFEKISSSYQRIDCDDQWRKTSSGSYRYS
ncbi:hypothetical protein Plhal304r1_c054g0139161 [Plasmopara halstedii]